MSVAAILDIVAAAVLLVGLLIHGATVLADWLVRRGRL